MKKNTGIFPALLPVVITLSLYIAFSERIATKPSDAGFWLILVLGISIGVALTRIIKWPKINN
jgi:hypothetical protein